MITVLFIPLLNREKNDIKILTYFTNLRNAYKKTILIGNDRFGTIPLTFGCVGCIDTVPERHMY